MKNICDLIIFLNYGKIIFYPLFKQIQTLQYSKHENSHPQKETPKLKPSNSNDSFLHSSQPAFSSSPKLQPTPSPQPNPRRISKEISQKINQVKSQVHDSNGQRAKKYGHARAEIKRVYKNGKSVCSVQKRGSFLEVISE